MTLTKITFVLASVLALLLILTLLLPSSTQIKRTKIIDDSAVRIFSLLNTSAGFQTFNPYKDTDPNLQIELFGPDLGINSGFKFKGVEGQGSQVISALEENRSVTMQIDLGNMGRPVQKIELAPLANGTQVTWLLSADFGYNPIARVFGLFMDSMMGDTFVRGLDNLSISVKSLPKTAS